MHDAQQRLARRRGRPTDPAKQAAIMLAAQAQFMTNGYAATSMTAIAAAAAVSKLTVYRHFGSKAALFAAAIAAKCRSMLAILDDQRLRGLETNAMLEWAGAAVLELILHPDALAIHDIIAAERSRSPELGPLFYTNAIAVTTERVAALATMLIERGTIAGDANGIAEDFLSLLSSRPTLHHQLGLPEHDTSERAAHIAHCATIIMRAYRPNGPTITGERVLSP